MTPNPQYSKPHQKFLDPIRLGYLINFNVVNIRDGIKRIAY